MSEQRDAQLQDLRSDASARAALELRCLLRPTRRPLRLGRKPRRARRPALALEPRSAAAPPRHGDAEPDTARAGAQDLGGARHRRPPEAGVREPDAFLQGSNGCQRAGGCPGLRDRDALLRLDRKPRSGCRGRVRCGRARRSDSQPGGHRRARASFRDLRRERLHRARDVRGLPATGTGARAPVPVGLPRREPARRSRWRASRRSRTRSQSS